MITPRLTRLIRVPDLRALHAATADLACHGPARLVRDSAVIVASRAAAQTLRTTLEQRLLTSPGATALWPDLVSRDDWYGVLRARLTSPPPRLTDIDRQVLMVAACRDAAARGHEAPFRLRPGLVAAMLDLYDELRRQPQSLERFESLLVTELESTADVDQGAERLLAQTRFLVGAFRAYQERLTEAGVVDEHALRELLMETASPDPLRRVVLTVGDRLSGRGGLWPADFDLLARLPALEVIEVVATEGELNAGLQERLHNLLPGIEEIAWTSAGVSPERETPVILAPANTEGAARSFVARDREEELAAVARRLKAARRGELSDVPAVKLDRTAVVFERPLPYIYLARSVFGSASIPYQAFDALPLAAEPFAATLDLVLSFVHADFSQSAIVALLGSPHLRFEVDGRLLEPADVSALEETLDDRGFLKSLAALADLDRDLAESSRLSGASEQVVRAARAARAAFEAGRALDGLTSQAPVSSHLSALAGFLDHYAHAPTDGPLRERHLRARAAIRSGLAQMIAAHKRFDDSICGIDEISATLRRWIDAQTFAPRTGSGGLHLLDARAARYGDFDAVHLVGLIEGEWPQPSTGHVFYSAGLLRKLGWAADRDRLSAERAAFRDLLHLARRQVSVSTFRLEHDSIVEPSSLLEVVEEAQGTVARIEESRSRIFRHEALTESPLNLSVLSPEGSAWARFRVSRTPAADRRYRGYTAPQVPGRYTVGGLERHLECPFKYFAERVLDLEPEEEDEAVMTPRERGLLIHEVFSAFFQAWQRRDGGTLTLDRIGEALDLFTDVLEAILARLPQSEALVERTRFLGSPVGAGLAEVVFRVEAERPARVMERLLEFKLEGEFDFASAGETRRVALRGVADRIDLLEDGTLRVIDYKSGQPPRSGRALQLPVYSLCAERVLDGRSNRRWSVGEALYISFKGRPVVPLFTRGADRDKVLTAAQTRLVEVVGAIERGDFPVQPDQPFFCSYCSFSSVCRKDYIDDL